MRKPVWRDVGAPFEISISTGQLCCSALYKLTPEAYCVHSSPSFDLKSQIHIIASYMSSSADQMAVCAGELQPVRHSLTRLEQTSQMQSLLDLQIAGKEEFRRS